MLSASDAVHSNQRTVHSRRRNEAEIVLRSKRIGFPSVV